MLLGLGDNKYNLLLMLRCSAIVLIITLITASFMPVTGHPSLKQFGKIKGRVVDVNSARIVRAVVLITGDGSQWRLMTNSEGEFETSLPAGIYELSVEADGFRRFASAKFPVSSGKTKRLNIEMQIRKPEMPVPARF